jgi:hypothetical protein
MEGRDRPGPGSDREDGHAVRRGDREQNARLVGRVAVARLDEPERTSVS